MSYRTKAIATMTIMFVILSSCAQSSIDTTGRARRDSDSSPQPGSSELASQQRSSGVPGTFHIFDPSYDFIGNGATNASQLASRFPIRKSRVALLSNGQDSFALRRKSLEKAQKSIRIQALIFTGDEAGLYVAEKLIAKKKSNPNIQIKIIVDSISNADQKSIALYLKLDNAGIPVIGYGEVPDINLANPQDIFAKANYRYHEKMWIIDGEDPQRAFAITGGLNIANEYFRVGHTDPSKAAHNNWKDQDVALQGTVIQDLMGRFDENYQKLAGEGKTENSSQWNELLQSGLGQLGKELLIELSGLNNQDATLQQRVRQLAQKDISHILFYDAETRFVASRTRPEYNEDQLRYIHNTYLDMIRSSNVSIEIENSYFILSKTVKEIREALVDAVKRGVDVRVLSNSEKSNDYPLFTSAARYYYPDYYEANKMAGINANGQKASFTMYEWHKPGFGTLHSKFAIFDGVAAIVGSYNLDSRSFRYNSENVVVFKNPTIVKQLQSEFRSNLTPENAKKFTADDVGQINKQSILNSLGGSQLAPILQDLM